MKRIIVVDDHPLVINAIKHMFENDNYTLVGHTADGLQVEHLIKKLAPDFMIIDIDIDNLSGLDVVSKLRNKGEFLPIIVMSGKNETHYSSLSEKAGANGFVSKKKQLSELLIAISAVSAGYKFFPMIRAGLQSNQTTKTDSEIINSLSVREYEVLEHMSNGIEVNQIASKMKLSDRTISTYKSRLMDKIGAKTRNDLYNFIRRNGI